MKEVVMRGESSGSRGGMMGEGGERGVAEDQGTAVEGWRGVVDGRLVRERRLGAVELSGAVRECK